MITFKTSALFFAAALLMNTSFAQDKTVINDKNAEVSDGEDESEEISSEMFEVILYSLLFIHF